VLAATCLIWLTVNVFNWNYGALAGVPIDFSKHWRHGLIDLSAWLGGLGLVLVFRSWLEQRTYAIAATLMAILLAGQVAVLLDKEKGARIWHRQVLAPASLAVAPRGNVFVVVLDMLQTDIAREALALRPDLKQALAGFSMYPNTVGAGTTTIGSAAAMLGGGNLTDPNDYFERRKRSLGMDEPNFLLKRLSDNGYDICQDGAIGPNTVTAPKCTLESSHDDHLLLVDLALFRALPQLAKVMVYNQQHWFLSDYGQATLPYRIDLNTFAALSKNLQVDSSAKPRFFWLHFMGAHIPIQLGSDCAPNDRAPLPINDQGWKSLVDNLQVTETRAAVVAQAVCYFDRFAAFLNKLRALGIYDNNLIVLAADHGDSFGNRRDWFERQRASARNEAYIPDAVLTAGTPLLGVKPLKAQGWFEERMEPATLCDIPKIILGQLGIPSDQEQQCLDIIHHRPSPARPRSFYHYRWTPETWSIGGDNFPDVEEFLVTGDSGQLESWQPTFRRRVNQKQWKPWTVLMLAAAGSARYLSVAGWQWVTTTGNQGAAAIVGAEARLYFGEILNGPKRLTLRVSNSLQHQSVRLAVGFENRLICHFSVGPGEASQELACPLPRLANMDYVSLHLSGAGIILPKLIVHEAQLKKS
jgi:hypothetical protein